MKKILIIIFCLIFASPIYADPCEGYWISYHLTKKYPQAAWHTYIDEKNGMLYGNTVALAETKVEEAKAVGCKGKKFKGYPIEIDGDMSEMTTIDMPWMINLKKKSEGIWEGGNIIDPSVGSMYQCRCIFHPADGKKYKVDTLEVRGEMIKGIGMSIYWTKCSYEDAMALQLK